MCAAGRMASVCGLSPQPSPRQPNLFTADPPLHSRSASSQPTRRAAARRAVKRRVGCRMPCCVGALHRTVLAPVSCRCGPHPRSPRSLAGRDADSTAGLARRDQQAPGPFAHPAVLPPHVPSSHLTAPPSCCRAVPLPCHPATPPPHPPLARAQVAEAMTALAEGNISRVGQLMVEAQEAFDACAMPMCPSQLTSPNLHRVLAYEPLKKHIWGGKGVGSQGDGCAQLLCKTEDDVATHRSTLPTPSHSLSPSVLHRATRPPDLPLPRSRATHVPRSYASYCAATFL